MSTFIKIFIVLILVFVAIVGIKLLINKDPMSTEVGAIVSETFDETDLSKNGSFIQVLRGLEKVTLNGDIFTSASFQSLVNFSLELKEEPKGRANPFKPIDPIERSLAISLSVTPPTMPVTATGTPSVFTQ